ncbi:CLUMA_CG018417, isoform A [Clunio marinus]|uniref:CLUMA_CG018417, isoform A n=1 Tax=Clunio marinus TaxID=568069 RepID=A0A1J1J220_9DIPT|nr:CLUMA_CG018417, isoform A [Clunio marinus]
MNELLPKASTIKYITELSISLKSNKWQINIYDIFLITLEELCGMFKKQHLVQLKTDFPCSRPQQKESCVKEK